MQYSGPLKLTGHRCVLAKNEHPRCDHASTLAHVSCPQTLNARAFWVRSPARNYSSAAPISNRSASPGAAAGSAAVANLAGLAHGFRAPSAQAAGASVFLAAVPVATLACISGGAHRTSSDARSEHKKGCLYHREEIEPCLSTDRRTGLTRGAACQSFWCGLSWMGGSL
jgi:hypothetical protein